MGFFIWSWLRDPNFGDRRHRKNLSPSKRKKNSDVFPENQEKTEVCVSGPQMQTLAVDTSEAAWGPPQFQEKRSRSEKAILGALGAFRGILGATLGIRKPQFSEQLPERFSELMETHMKYFHLPMHSRSVFSRIGVVPARKNTRTAVWVSTAEKTIPGKLEKCLESLGFDREKDACI